MSRLFVAMVALLALFGEPSQAKLQTEFGDNLSPYVQQKITSWLSQVPQPSQSIILSFGNAKLASQIIPPALLAGLGPEGAPPPAPVRLLVGIAHAFTGAFTASFGSRMRLYA